MRVEQLGDQELILFDPSSSYHELTSAMFRAAGVSPRGVMVLDSIDAAKRMVQLGLGIALLPRSALSDELEDGSLAAVTVVSTAPVRRQIVAIRRRDAGELGARARSARALRPGRRRRLSEQVGVSQSRSGSDPRCSDSPVSRLVLAERLAHRAADLARAWRARARRRRSPAARSPRRARSRRAAPAAPPRRATALRAGAHRLETRDLAARERGIDLERRRLGVVALAVAVDADDDALARLQRHARAR